MLEDALDVAGEADLPGVLAAVGVAAAAGIDAAPVVAEAPPDAADSDLADSVLLPLSACFSAVFFAALVLLPPLLKSVTYQPPPFSWNPAAVTILLNVAFLHSGQSVSLASLMR